MEDPAKKPDSSLFSARLAAEPCDAASIVYIGLRDLDKSS